MVSFIINYWIEIVFSLIVTFLTYLYRKIKKYIKKIDILKDQACLNLKMHISEKYELIKKKNFITMEEKEEIITLYELYKKLECSNIADEMVKEINNIPFR